MPRIRPAKFVHVVYRTRRFDEMTAQLALRSDYTPITDMRASKAYRSLAAEKLLLKSFIETTEADAETRVVGERRRVHG